jgi:RNA polymerase sigma-70 factor (ECF subfamily)
MSLGERPTNNVSAGPWLGLLDSTLDRATNLKVARASDGPTTDVDLVVALRTRAAGARRDVVHRYGGHVRAILVRLLGADDTERADLLQDVFVRVFEGIDHLESAESFKAWLSRITVFVAREHIRRKRRWRWMMPFGDPPDTPSATAGESTREAVRCVYAALDRLPVDERLVFALHLVQGLELGEIAPMCGMSYATARRRLARARRRFTKQAARFEALHPWIGQ